jgi:hypothetical protein
VIFHDRRIERAELMNGGFWDRATVSLEPTDLLVSAGGAGGPVSAEEREAFVRDHPTFTVERACRRNGLPRGFGGTWTVTGGLLCREGGRLTVEHIGEVVVREWRVILGCKVSRKTLRKIGHGGRWLVIKVETKGPFLDPRGAARALNFGTKLSRFYRPLPPPGDRDRDWLEKDGHWWEKD